MANRIALVLAIACAAAMPAHAQTLLMDRVQQQQALARPSRGMTMAQVEARFGAPSERLDARGGQRRDWPTINRWSYPPFTVYFERSKVIDVVLNKATPGEVAPVPVPQEQSVPQATPRHGASRR